MFKRNNVLVKNNAYGAFISSREEYLTTNPEKSKLQAIDIPSYSKNSICYERFNQTILGINVEEKILCIFDKNGVLLRKIRPNHLLLQPFAICTSIVEESNKVKIFISDHGLHRILEFNENYKFQKEFAKELDIDYMTIDQDNSLLYGIIKNHDIVSIWNFQDGSFNSQFSIKSPTEIKVSSKYIYLIGTQASNNIPKASNLNTASCKDQSIYILDKNSLEIIFI